MTVREGAPFTRTDLAKELDDKKIGNRMLFGGNLVRQPAFVQLKRDNPAAIRVVDCSASGSSASSSSLDLPPSTLGPSDASSSSALRPPTLRPSDASPLPVADRIMNQTLFLGTYPGLTAEQIDYMVKVIRDFAASRNS
jgi:CDP-6-deoxy-D-xylo-4-hexulose-3-dehydrase